MVTAMAAFLGKNRFESARKLTSVKAPILIARDPDHTIPTGESQMLFASANDPKKLLIFVVPTTMLDL